MVGGAVLGLDNLVVAVHDLAGERRAADAADAVGDEDQTGLQVGKTEARLEKGGGGRGHHAPDGVDDGAEEEGDDDVLFGHEAEGGEESREGQFGGRGSDVVFFGSRVALFPVTLAERAVEEGAVNALERDGAVASNSAQGFGEQEQDGGESDATEDEEEPEDGVEAEILGDDTADDWAHGKAEHADWWTESCQSHPFLLQFRGK